VEKPPPSRTECVGHNDGRQTEIKQSNLFVNLIEFPIKNMER